MLLLKVFLQNDKSGINARINGRRRTSSSRFQTENSRASFDNLFENSWAMLEHRLIMTQRFVSLGHFVFMSLI